MDPTDNDDSDFDDTSSPPFDDELFDSPTHEQIETAARKARANAHVQDEDAAAARLLQASIERREREEGVRARERKRKRGEGDGVGVDGDAEGETDEEMGSGEDDEGGCGDAVGESDEEMGGEENAVSGSEDAVGESEDALGESEDAMGESDDAVGQDEDATGESDDAMGQDKDVEGERDNAEGESDDAVAQDKGAEKMKKDLERPPAISEKLTSVMKQRGTLMKQIVDDMQLQQKRRQQAKPETSTSPTKSPSGPSKPSSTFLQHLRQARKRDLKARVRAPAFHPRYPAYDGHARMMKDRKNQEWLLELEGGGREKVVKDERERIQTHKVLEDLEEAKRDEAERAERRGIRRGDREIAAQPPPTPRPTNLELSAPVPGSKGNPGADRRLSDDQGSRWRTPGRQRGQLNLDMTRIQTQFILSDHFIDDVNVMLDFTRSWSIEAFRPIYLSFKAAPENVGREIDSFRTLDWVDRSQWNWNVHIRSAKPYKPPEASYFGVNKAELVEEGLLPESCTKKGCTAGCPRSRTPSDYARSLMNGLNVRQKEKGGSKLGSVAPPKAAVKAKSREEIKMLDTMRMPPPFSRARRVRKGRPSVSHVAAQCPGLLKGLLEGTEPSPRPAPLSLSAANLSRIPDTTNLPSPESPLWRTGLLPDENKGSTPKLTLKIGLKPEPKPVEQSPLTKYFSTAGTPRVREDYFAKALPVSATQVTPPAVPEVKAIEAPEASVAQKNDKDVREFLLTRWKAKNKQSKRPKKQHNRVEEWQEAAKRPIQKQLDHRAKHRHIPWHKITHDLYMVRQDHKNPVNLKWVSKYCLPDYYTSSEAPERSLKKYTAWNSLKAIFEGPGSVPDRQELGERVARLLETAPVQTQTQTPVLRALEGAPVPVVQSLEDASTVIEDAPIPVVRSLDEASAVVQDAPLPVVRSLDEASIVVEDAPVPVMRSLDEGSITMEGDPPPLVTEILAEMSSSEEEEEVKVVESRGVKRRQDSSQMVGRDGRDVKKRRR